MKKSKQRDAIIAELHSRCDHPTAEDIYLNLKKTMPNLSLGTVYRNLNRLSSEGVIGKLFIGGADRFDYNANNHYHLLCTKCNGLFDINMPIDSELDQQASNYVNGVVVTHSLTFIGECENCSH